jgi:hypothetical protein
MSITVSWDDKENNIIRYDLSGWWNWDDYRMAVDQCAAMLEGIKHPVGIIAHVHADTMAPRSIVKPATQELLIRRSNLPDNVRVIVVTGGTAFIEMIMAGFCRAFKRVEKKFLVAGSLEEARQIVRDRLSTAQA